MSTLCIKQTGLCQSAWNIYRIMILVIFFVFVTHFKTHFCEVGGGGMEGLKLKLGGRIFSTEMCVKMGHNRTHL